MCYLWHALSKREKLLSYLSRMCFYISEEETFDVNSKREKISIKESLVLKFHCAMTCCVSINAKEGDFWIQLSNCVFSLMSHKCHISCQVVSTKLT